MEIYQLEDQEEGASEGNRLLRQLVDGSAQVPVQCYSLCRIYFCVHSSMTSFFQVDGFDKDGFPLKRISPTAITGQSPGKVGCTTAAC
jgi:hypothetical protein